MVWLSASAYAVGPRSDQKRALFFWDGAGFVRLQRLSIVSLRRPLCRRAPLGFGTQRDQRLRILSCLDLGLASSRRLSRNLVISWVPEGTMFARVMQRRRSPRYRISGGK